MKPAIILTSLAALFGSNLHADTVIEFRIQDDKSQFLTNGKMARINKRDSDEYMLVNFDNSTIYSITPGKKQVINISDTLPSFSSTQAPPIRLKLRPMGKGPTIAGYPTVQYRLVANGEHCGSIYASREALRGTAIESMFDTLKTMADSHRQSLGAFAALIPVCQMAKMELADRLQDLGAPMRITDKDGRIDTEISMIRKDARVAAENYAFPPYYQLASMSDTLQSAQKKDRQMDSMPNKQRTMHELQQGRYPPPAAMQQMRRYHEMMHYRR